MQSAERDIVEKLFASREVDCKGVGKVQVYTTRNKSQPETNLGLDETLLEENLHAASLSLVMEPGVAEFAVVPAEKAVEQISLDLRSASYTNVGSTLRKWPVAVHAHRRRSRSIFDLIEKGGNKGGWVPLSELTACIY
eukprot:1490822-Pyramimonas_sp.AAC.1